MNIYVVVSLTYTNMWKLTNKERDYHGNQNLVNVKDFAHRMSIKYDIDESVCNEAIQDMFNYMMKMILERKIIYVKEFFKLGIKQCKAVNVNVLNKEGRSSYLYDKPSFKFLIPFKNKVKALRGTQRVDAGKESEFSYGEE